MERWRRISLMGIILGFVVLGIDSFVATIPYVIIIPLQAVAITLIFRGLIIRKKLKDM